MEVGSLSLSASSLHLIPFKMRANIPLADIPLLFGTINSVHLRDLEPYELEAQKYFQQALVTFVKDPHDGLKNFGWPVYNPNSKLHGVYEAVAILILGFVATSLVELFKNNSPIATFTEASTYDTICFQF